MHRMERAASDSALIWLREHPRLYWPLRRTRTALGQLLPPRTLPGIPGKVHPNDPELVGRSGSARNAYAAAGREALDLVATVLSRVHMSWADVQSCLDFGCGYGRVMRWLRLQLEPERLVAADVDPAAVRFCAQEFDVRPIRLAIDPRVTDVGKHSLIWVGSVFTHLPGDVCGRLSASLSESLQPGGVLVLSTHGPSSLDRATQFGAGVSRDRGAIDRELTRHGISYRPYPHYRHARYGLTWHTEEYVQGLFGTRGNLTFIFSRAAGWCRHHDVYAFQRPVSLPR
jgi:SAM-dependent methyltransferase